MACCSDRCARPGEDVSPLMEKLPSIEQFHYFGCLPYIFRRSVLACSSTPFRVRAHFSCAPMHYSPRRWPTRSWGTPRQEEYRAGRKNAFLSPVNSSAPRRSFSATSRRRGSILSRRVVWRKCSPCEGKGYRG